MLRWIMGTAASVTTSVSVEYEDLESLNFCKIIPNCTEKTLAIYASRFPNTLDQRVLKFVFSKLNDGEPYSLVYFHAGIQTRPSLSFIKQAYQQLDYHYRKRLVKLYIIHPTFWVRSVHAIMRPIVSPKVWTKILCFNSLESLNKYILLTRFRESLPKVVLDTDKEWGTSTKEINFKEPNPFPHVGINTIELKQRDNSLLLFEATIKYLKTNSLRTPGIFRKNPDKTKMLAQLDYLESTAGTTELNTNNSYRQLDNTYRLFNDCHQVTGLLKLFLRELPDSIIPRCHFDHLADEKNTAENLKSGVLNEDSVKLFELLALIADNKDDNLMSAQALAVCFAPIVCGTDDVQKLQMNIHNVIRNVGKLIELFQNEN